MSGTIKSNPIKIVVDTNIWISFLITNDFSKFDRLLFSGRCRILISPDLIEELKAVSQRGKMRKYFSVNSFVSMIDAFDPFMDLIEIKSDISRCRDPKDDFLLALAIDGNADYLIAGDSDLLSIEDYEGTKITTIKDFFIEVNSDKRIK